MMTTEDRRQIGLTEDGRAAVSKLTNDFAWFAEAQEAGRFAFGYAVRAGVAAGQTDKPVETRWSPDSFDPTGEIRTLIRVIYPETSTPIRLLEYLIDEGFRRILAQIEAGSNDPVALLGDG